MTTFFFYFAPTFLLKLSTCMFGRYFKCLLVFLLNFGDFGHWSIYMDIYNEERVFTVGTERPECFRALVLKGVGEQHVRAMVQFFALFCESESCAI